MLNKEKNPENYYRIAIVGSDDELLSDADKQNLFPLCNELGKLLVSNNCIVFTGGDGGVGKEVLKGVRENGGITISFFPGMENTLGDGLVTIPILTGVGYGIRDIIMLRSVEGVIAISGGCGTLNELTNAYHLYKPIVVLKGSGGWSERLGGQYIDERKKVRIECCDTPKEIIKKIITEINKKRRLFQLMRAVHKKQN